jgi:hypothetical protein
MIPPVPNPSPQPPGDRSVHCRALCACPTTHPYGWNSCPGTGSWNDIPTASIRIKTEFRRLSDGVPYWTSLSVQLIPDPYPPTSKPISCWRTSTSRRRLKLSCRSGPCATR